MRINRALQSSFVLPDQGRFRDDIEVVLAIDRLSPFSVLQTASPWIRRAIRGSRWLRHRGPRLEKGCVLLVADFEQSRACPAHSRFGDSLGKAEHSRTQCVVVALLCCDAFVATNPELT